MCFAGICRLLKNAALDSRLYLLYLRLAMEYGLALSGIAISYLDPDE